MQSDQQEPPRPQRELQDWVHHLHDYRQLKESTDWDGMTPRGHPLEKWVQKQRTLYNQGKLMAWKKRMLEDAGFDFVAPRTAKVPTDVDYAHQLVAFYKEHGHYAPTQTVGGAGLTKWWTEFRQSKGARGLASGDSTSAREARKVLKKQIPGFSFDAPTKAEINRASGRSFNGFLPAQRTPPVDLMIHARMHETPRSLWNSYNSITGQTGELGALRTLLRRADLFGQVLRVDVDCNDGVKQGWLTGLDVQMLDAMHAVTCMVSPRPQAITAIPLTLTDCHRSELVYLASGSRCGALFTDTEGRQIVISYDAVLADQSSCLAITSTSFKRVGSCAYQLTPQPWVLQDLLEGRARRLTHLTTANKRFYDNLNVLVDWTDQAKGAGTPHVVWNSERNSLFKFLEHMVRKMEQGLMNFSHTEQLRQVDATWGRDLRALSDMFGPILHPLDHEPL